MVKDTSTAAAVLFDNSGHWTQPSAIKNAKIWGVQWESPGLPNPVPAPPTGGGVPANQTGLTAPTILKTASGPSFGATVVQRGGIGGISENNGSDYVIQEGPLTALLGGGAPVDLTAAGSTYAAAGVINAAAIYGFDPFGNGDGIGGFAVQVAGGTPFLYTGILRVAAVTVGPQTLGASGTTVLKLGQLGATSALPTNWPTIGICVANPAATSSPLQGPIVMPFTAATGGQITVAITAQNASAVLGGNTIVTLHQFTGCTTGTGTAPDLALATQSARNITGTKINGFQLFDQPNMGGGPIGMALLNTGSQVDFPPVATLSVLVGNHGAVSFTLGVSEWAKWSPNAGKTATLPAVPTPGQPIRLELLTAFDATVSGNGNTIYYQGASVGTSQTIPAGVGQVYEYTWDSVNSWWECVLISANTPTFVQLGNGTTAGSKLWSGSGAPNIATSVAGDFYFRTDTPGTSSQRIYIATAANTWTALVV